MNAFSHAKALLACLGTTLAFGVLSAAASTTGDPLADGWSPHGNSLASGTYIRGSAGYSFDVYSTDFSLPNATSDWLAGDQIIGLGAAGVGQFVFWPRLVAKFGSSSAVFTASSLPSPAGNGNGSFSSGMGGLGSVQVDFDYEFDGPNASLRPGLAGTTMLPDNVLYNGPHRLPNGSPDTFCDSAFASNQCGIGAQYARVVALFARDANGQDRLESFELLLNLSYLKRGGYDLLPQINGTSDLALQTLANEFTDALVTAVPEPSTYGMLLAGLALIVWRKKIGKPGVGPGIRLKREIGV